MENLCRRGPRPRPRIILQLQPEQPLNRFTASSTDQDDPIKQFAPCRAPGGRQPLVLMAPRPWISSGASLASRKNDGTGLTIHPCYWAASIGHPARSRLFFLATRRCEIAQAVAIPRVRRLVPLFYQGRVYRQCCTMVRELAWFGPVWRFRSAEYFDG